MALVFLCGKYEVLGDAFVSTPRLRILEGMPAIFVYRLLSTTIRGQPRGEFALMTASLLPKFRCKAGMISPDNCD